ncbi:uncharacterized protein B0P05DRAFT_549292 [Gilbertella persicaria]|nr:uncharacterized protein B0P05DRAFT_549292 [Gilbertella persicaria]KAI8072201.1 hypothetical protein B0P05DRAFT_549292 [Gilbertella persicaria]
MFEEPNPVYEAPEEQAMDTNAYEQYYTDQSFMQPPPMPPPTTSEENELFSNVIMSWYYAGYYTALYQASVDIFS